MSQLSDIQNLIKNRFRVPLETGIGDPVYMEDGRVSLPDSRAVQTPSPFALPKGTTITPTQEPNQQPTKPRLNPSLPVMPSDESQQPQTQASPFSPPSQSKLSQVGEPPPPMQWNPIRTKSSGEPEISPTARGDRVSMLEQERNALERWKPQGHRGARQILKEGFEGAAAAGAANPN